MKRGTKVKIEFTGKLEQKPVVIGENESFLRVRVDGKPGWVAIVPFDAATVEEDN